MRAPVWFSLYSVALRRNCKSQFSNSGERTQTVERSKLQLAAMIAKIKNVQKRAKLYRNLKLLLKDKDVLKNDQDLKNFFVDQNDAISDNKINRLSRQIVHLIHK
jgi:hypothetical protein